MPANYISGSSEDKKDVGGDVGDNVGGIGGANSGSSAADDDPQSRRLNSELREIKKKVSNSVGVGKLAGNTTLVDREIYEGLKDKNNNSPAPNHGISVLFAFTSPASASVGSDITDFASYIPTSKYSILLNWDERVFDKKIAYSASMKKAYLDVRVRDKDTGAWDTVSWVLSSRAQQGRTGEVWLVDSMLVRGQKRGY
ncbi:hypothetical protein TrRE_jg6105 [Triparma retinervis]|uniref:Uncharacterized protein n=1 Tax=Triparma retinervis TaxID=2557542 RepID=A0A9W7ADW4_9STRA|nr:hypothetical protein TrRE_jg6105 [Triparma retinervis]